MHPDMLLLAQRLVVAVERMSQDVNNIAAYMYDLSYSVSHFINEKREKEDISQLSCDEGDSLSTCQPSVGQEDSAVSEYSMPCEQADGGSVCITHNVKQENSARDVASMESDDLPSGHCMEINQGLNIGCNAATSCLQIASSSYLPLSFDAKQMNNEEHISENDYSSDCNTVLFENSEYQNPLGVASYSLADVSLSQEGAVDRHMFQEHGGKSMAGVCQSLRTGKHEVNNGDNPRTLQGSASQSSSCERIRGGFSKRTLECTVCKKIFENNTKLRRHMVVHTGEKPFKCNQCGQAFNRMDVLASHMKIHTGVRPFKCSVCKNSFAQSGNLKIHMRTHSGEKPFKCNLCGKSFPRSNTLTDHLQTHEGRFRCHHCGKEFSRGRALTYHMKTHSGEMP